MKDSVNYYTPEIVRTILGNQIWARSSQNKESVDEIPSAADYYDGANNLNNVRVDCAINTDKTDCLKNSYCGIDNFKK